MAEVRSLRWLSEQRKQLQLPEAASDLTKEGSIKEEEGDTR